MTILVIGATGFIGPHLVRQLVEQDHDVIVFHRGETTADLPDAARKLHGDRNALTDHRTAFERVAPDVAIDLVPYTEAQARQAVDVFRGLTGLTERVVGWRGEIVPLPDDQLPEHLQAPFDWRYELATDTQRLRDELDYRDPVSFEDALRRTADWERTQCPDDTEVPEAEYAAEDATLRHA